jgi:hypothetical protein
MALSTLKNRETYKDTSGNTTSFPFTISGIPVPFFALTDIKVFVQTPTATTETELTYNASPSDNTQFSITATNNDTQQGGTITLGGTGYVANTLISIERVVPLSQEYDLQEGATIDPTALNTALDRTVAQSQQITDDQSQSITFPKTDLTSITYNVSESATSRANKVIGFDNNGNINTQSFSSVAGASLSAGNGIEISGGNVRLDNSTDFTFSGSGELQLATDSVDTAEIKANAVDTAEIKDNAVTTAKILSDNVTYDKIQDISTSNSVLGNTATGTVTERALVGDILLDEDTMSSNSAIKGATQQSIKAYVDNYNIDKHYYIYQTGNARNGATDGIWVGWSEICKTTGATHIASYDNSTGIFTFASTGTYYVHLDFKGFDRDTTAGDSYYVVIGKGDNSDEQLDTPYTHGDVTSTDSNAVALKNMAASFYNGGSAILSGFNNEVFGVITVSDVSTDKLRCHTNEVSGAALDHWEARAIMKVMKIT